MAMTNVLRGHNESTPVMERSAIFRNVEKFLHELGPEQLRQEMSILAGDDVHSLRLEQLIIAEGMRYGDSFAHELIYIAMERRRDPELEQALNDIESASPGA